MAAAWRILSPMTHGDSRRRKKKGIHMYICKEPFVRDRIREISPGFGWIDNRLVRGHHIEKCTVRSLALYLFLAVVADGQGVSWWKERSIGERLGLSVQEVRAARNELENADLVAFQDGVWQVLSLGEVRP